jgi:hypothetical protein
MDSPKSRAVGSKTAKRAVVAVMAAAAVGLAAPVSSAAHESSWSYGCRGYWYTTSGHGHCSKSTQTTYKYMATYDCDAETDLQESRRLPYGFSGKFSTHECTFKINKATVGLD